MSAPVGGAAPASAQGRDVPVARPLPVPILATLIASGSLALVAVFFAVYAFGFSALQEQRSQHQLYAQLRGLLSPSSRVAPAIGGAIRPGTPVALINAPRGVLDDVVIVEGTSSADLLAGPGHLRDSPLPGQPGESIVMGRSVTAGAPFDSIGSLRTGDVITVVTGQGHFRFRVVDTRTAGSVLPQLGASGSLLTLETTVGSGFLGSLHPSRLEYVDAQLVGSPAAAPAGHVLAVPATEQQGHADPTAWPYVVFWLQGLLVAACGTAWLLLRWGRWHTWLVATPVLLALLWGLSTESMRLLPNVM
jgi:sortase A